MPVMHHVEQRQAHLWRYLYDPQRLYVCDRHFSVSAPVYDRLYSRPVLDISYWLREVFVVYLDVPEAELQRRHKATNDAGGSEHASRVRQLYHEHIRNFEHARLDGTKPTIELCELVSVLARSIANA